MTLNTKDSSLRLKVLDTAKSEFGKSGLMNRKVRLFT
jgi:hypothetical protein